MKRVLFIGTLSILSGYFYISPYTTEGVQCSLKVIKNKINSTLNTEFTNKLIYLYFLKFNREIFTRFNSNFGLNSFTFKEIETLKNIILFIYKNYILFSFLNSDKIKLGIFLFNFSIFFLLIFINNILFKYKFSNVFYIIINLIILTLSLNRAESSKDLQTNEKIREGNSPHPTINIQTLNLIKGKKCEKISKINSISFKPVKIPTSPKGESF